MTPLADTFDLAPLLTAEELDWAERARSFARDQLAPVVDEDFENRHFRRELLPAFGAAGFLGMHLQDDGCAGAGAVSYGLVCHELEAVDSGWRTFVSVQGSLAMTAISRFGSAEQKALLPAMARGELIGCFALTEPQGGSDPAAMTTVAIRDGDDWLITGHKRWIGLAGVADVAVVWARTDDGVRGFVVDTASPGFTATIIDNKLSMRTSVQYAVDLDACRVPASAQLPDAIGLSAPFTCLNEARFGIVWGAMGAARSCLEAAIERSTTRQVFGAPIGSKQLVQQRLADMLVEYEKGMLLALHLGRLEERGAITPAQLSVGKLNNVREALKIAHAARTILGGDGVTDEFPVMRHMNNLESVRTYEGTDDIHTLVIGRSLTGLSAF
ncbi:acyl-CoA dehydrogenase family protein [Leifsonia lichenia]